MSRTIPIYMFILIQMSVVKAWNSRLYSRSTSSTFRTYSGSPGGQFYIAAKPCLKVMPKMEFLPEYRTIDDVTAESHEVYERYDMDQEISGKELNKEESYLEEELLIDLQKQLADYDVPIYTNSSEDTEPELPAFR